MQTVTLYQKDKMEDKYMAIIKPFVAVRPDAKVADRVAALPYDHLCKLERRNTDGLD